MSYASYTSPAASRASGGNRNTITLLVDYLSNALIALVWLLLVSKSVCGRETLSGGQYQAAFVHQGPLSYHQFQRHKTIVISDVHIVDKHLLNTLYVLDLYIWSIYLGQKGRKQEKGNNLVLYSLYMHGDITFANSKGEKFLTDQYGRKCWYLSWEMKGEKKPGKRITVGNGRCRKNNAVGVSSIYVLLSLVE